MRQSFLAEVYDEGGSLHLNRSSDEPQWSVESLKPGTSYTIRISAFNAKGRSPTIILTAATLKVAEQRVGENKSLLSSPLIIIFVSILGVFLFLILVLVLVTRWRKNNNTGGTSGSASVVASSKSSPPVEGQAGGGGGGGGGGLQEAGEGGGDDRQGGMGKDEGMEKQQQQQQQQKASKPKKKVVVVENGKDRVGLGDVASGDITTSKDALLGRYGSVSQPLANGSAGYYNSLGKTSFPSTFPVASSSSSNNPSSSTSSSSPNNPSSSCSSSTLPRSLRISSSPSGPLSLHLSHTPLAPTLELPEEAEDYVAPPYSTHRFCETLPRNHGRPPRRELIDAPPYRGVGVAGRTSPLGGEAYRGMGVGGFSSGKGGGSDRVVDPYRGGMGGGMHGDPFRGGGMGGGAKLGPDVYRDVHDPYGVLGGNLGGGGGGGGGMGDTYRGKSFGCAAVFCLVNTPKEGNVKELWWHQSITG
ncbi:hapless 2-like [Penaeus chinensis]|uniref:hapless 2-like n=1 Tax=Penaeus chinensis TaxID=139456 RepID=UPI001FB7FB11|nr:hapless 2-like [Penaeus chinensis]